MPRQERRERMKRWASSRPEFAVKGKGRAEPRSGKGSSRVAERDLDGAEARDQAWLAPAALQKRCDEVALVVQAARDEVPTALIPHITLGADVRNLDRDIKASTGQSLEQRRALGKRLEDIATEATQLLKLVSGQKELLAWADAHPWRSTAVPLGNLLAAVGQALADVDGKAFKTAIEPLLILKVTWTDIDEQWAALQERFNAIAVPCAALPGLARKLPQTKPLVASLKACADVAPLGLPLTLALATTEGSLLLLDGMLGKVERVCKAFAGVPNMSDVLDSATPSRFTKWPERERLFDAIADTLAQGDVGALAKAVADLADLVALANDAALDVKALQGRLSTLGGRAKVVCKAVDTASGGAADSERWVAMKLLAQATKALGGGLTPALVPAAARGDLDADVTMLETWCTAVEAACGDTELMGTVKDAFKGVLKGPGGPARMTLVAAFGNPANTATVINDAYNDLLDCNGPWSEARKATAAAPTISAWLQAHWGFPAGVADPLAVTLARIDRKITALFTTAGLTGGTFTLLRGRMGGSLPDTIAAVRAYPREATLVHYAAYLQHKAVNAANLAALVTAGQVDFDTNGHGNPFRYYCGHCHMNEAEAKANVTWRHSTGGPPVVWGVVHVHYHGLTHTTPNGSTYYHVKASNFSPPVEELTDGAAKGRVNAVIPAGLPMP